MPNAPVILSNLVIAAGTFFNEQPTGCLMSHVHITPLITRFAAASLECGTIYRLNCDRYTKVCRWGAVPDVITPVKFSIDGFKGFDFQGSKNRCVPFTRRVALTTVLHYRDKMSAMSNSSDN